VPRDNVETVRASIAAFEDGGLDAVAELWDADIEWRAIEGALDDVGEIHGKAAMRRYLQEWIDLFDPIAISALELRDAGEDRVVARQRASGRAKISGAETAIDYGVVYTLRDGRVARGREYASFDQALEAVGLTG
jgi:ketosteroid isomerase-like protein